MKPVDHFYAAIDCADPEKLAKFYAHITGLKIDLTTENTNSDIVWIELKDNQGIPKLGFQKWQITKRQLGQKDLFHSNST